ncbi:MAG: PP2C family protein-serine/threonine phosphatase [Pseudonocardiaceae bacterium]
MSEQTNTTDTIAVAGTALVDTLRVVVATSRHARSRNEDAIGVGGWVLHGDHPDPLEITIPLGPDYPVAIAVADGMGGHPDGDRAARIAVEQLTRPAPPGESTEITEAFRRADTAIRIAAADRSRGMGCTAATLSLGIDGHSTIANVGDVRIYRIIDGYLGQLTVDDRPSGAASSAVTRCLGGHAPTAVEAHVHHLALRPGDRLVLCTDGLHDAVALSAKRLPSSWDATQLVAHLMRAALRVDHGDNVTVALVDLPAAKTTLVATPTITLTEPAAEPAESPSPLPSPLPEHRPSLLRRLVFRIRSSRPKPRSGLVQPPLGHQQVDHPAQPRGDPDGLDDRG